MVGWEVEMEEMAFESRGMKRDDRGEGRTDVAWM